MSRTGWTIRTVTRGMALALAGACAAAGFGDCQSAATAAKPGAVLVSSAAEVAAVREVDDLATGTRWLLVRDPEHPAGPGRWVRSEEASPAESFATTGDKAAPAIGHQSDAAAGPSAAPLAGRVTPPAAILMRGGDLVIVEQQTPVLTARLAAVALEPATLGRLFRVRLKATGARVWAIALGPGEARLAPPGVVGQ